MKAYKHINAWVLWTGNGYSDEESGLSMDSNDGVAYFEDLDETKDQIQDELN